MKHNKPIYLSIVLLGVALGGLAVYRWYEARLWPFSTGTRNEAFLGTTFGMSPQEVRRALRKHGTQLLTYEEYKQIEADPLIQNWDQYLLFSEDRRRSASLFMHSLEMFESKVEAEFKFQDGRLDYIAVHFNPVSASKAQSVADAVESELHSSYGLSTRDESKGVPGAYSLNFKATSVTPSLWVNLTEPEKPIIILNLIHVATQSQRRQEIEQRERSAFGTKN